MKKIFLFLVIPIYSFGQSAVKLIVDNGRYSESEWCRQLALTDDNRTLIINDFENGLRLYDANSGELINQFAGHSLEGDLYMQSSNKILLTTGDKKIKIWDITKNKLIKDIKQNFHSQFMNDVYIDHKMKYVFAEKTKYDVSTSKAVKSYSFDKMYFYKDHYFVFNQQDGRINEYDTYTDNLTKSYLIENYERGYNIFFNENKGILFIGFKNGVHAVNIRTGKKEIILFDRSYTFDNLSICSNFDFSFDHQYFIASSHQGKDNRIGGDGHLIIMKYNNSESKWDEIYRDNNVTNEVVFFNNSHRAIVSRTNTIEIINIDTINNDISAKALVGLSTLKNPSLISYLKNEPNNIQLTFAGDKIVHVLDVIRAVKNNHGIDLIKYFKLIDDASFEREIGFCQWREGADTIRLPSELRSFYINRETYSLFNIENFKFKNTGNSFSISNYGTLNSTYNPVKGKNYCPSSKIYAVETSFQNVSYYKINNSEATLIASAPTTGVIYHIEYSKDESLSAFGGSDRKVTVVDLKNKKIKHTIWAESYVTSISFSNDNQSIFIGTLKNEIQIFSLITGKLIKKLKGFDGAIKDLEVTIDDKYLLSISEDKSLRVWEIKSGNLKTTSYFDIEGGFLTFTPEGYFSKSERFLGKVSYLINNSNISFDQLYENYYRPDIIRAVFSHQDTSIIKTSNINNGVKSPPSLKINLSKSKNRGVIIEQIENSLVSINLIISDAGGGIGGYKLFNNNKLIEDKILIPSILKDSIVTDISFEASAGKNLIYAVAISSDGIESKPVSVEYIYSPDYKQNIPSKPNIYILSIGINEYKNQKYNLNYCVNDMNSFTDTIKLISQKIFENVWIRKISNDQATKLNVINALEEVSKLAKPEDVFIFYYAGHGIALNNNDATTFFLVTQSVTQMTDLNNCITNGISDIEIKNLFKKIKANKQISFIDACNSGAMAEQFSIRGAAEENAIAKLSRSTGSAIFASTTSDQYASEFTQIGHGVFTFVLLNALGGRASLDNCQITAATLKGFIDEEVPIVTQKYKGTSQYPTTFMFGQDFPIGIKCKIQ